MGSRPARRLFVGTLTCTITMALAASLAMPFQAQGWGVCGGEDDTCSRVYLNVATREGEAHLSVDQACGSGWRHAWSRADARRTIRQWLDGQAALGAGSLCIALDGRVDEIRITSIGGHCGYDGGEANAPGPNRVLRAGYGENRSATLAGCHASIGEMAFGGIALDFADGYGFGDSYATGYFYGVYDGFGRDTVSPTDASVWQISQFNTYHYRVEILADGSPDWRADFPEEDR